MKGMANYEKQVEQEAAYPIPISLYNCYRTVRQEKRGIAIYILLIAFLMPHCPVTVVQRYRDGVCSLLFHLFFIICHPYIPLHLEEMIFLYLYKKLHSLFFSMYMTLFTAATLCYDDMPTCLAVRYPTQSLSEAVFILAVLSGRVN